MSWILRIIIDLLLVSGGFFALAGTVGLIRMPDAMSRMQASTAISTLGMFLSSIGGLIYAIFVEKNTAMAVKIVLIVLFVLLTNPVANHAICRAAYRGGIRPTEKRLARDDYGRDRPYD